ncbi:MAG: carbon-nitrogen hydrolase family protein [Gammaproteobacteria bacterium]|nr:carbon-nitrogen hydrolase family protein [Gammaproteobacteria bacterium]
MAVEKAAKRASTVIVAAVQMSSGSDVAGNLAEAERLLGSAAQSGVTLAVLPENFAFMGKTDAERLKIAEPSGDGQIQRWLTSTAKKFGMWLVGGTIPVTAGSGRCYSSCFVVDAAGKVVARYDKRHLFDVVVPGSTESYRESTNTVAGEEIVVCDSPLGVLGLGVCYDLRFPEHFRSMLEAGMQAVALPAAFTRPTGDAHWEVLIRARAVENLCPVIAAAQCGRHAGGRETWGHSMVVDAWGQVIVACADEPGIAVAGLDMQAVQKIRTQFPALRHRNP